MIRINLLPIRQMKKRLRTRNESIVFLISLVVLLALLVMAALSMNQKAASLQADIKVLNAKKAKLNATINEIKKLEKERDQLMAKVEAIKQLKSKSQITVHLLDEISSATSSDSIWLESLKQSGQVVSLTGIALDNTRLADYMDSLTASPYFSSATLGKSAMTMIAGQKLKSFSLSLAIHDPARTKPDQTQDKVK